MKSILLIAALAAAVLFPSLASAEPVAGPIAAAVADTGRPPKDLASDAQRRPGEVLTFTGVHSGDSVADLMPGSGYFTRILSKAVGPTGHVYAIVPQEFASRFPDGVKALNALAADPAYANVSVLIMPINDFVAPMPLDLVWTAQNYHDMYDAFMGPADVPRVNKAIRATLKPGGTFLVLDHADAPGTGVGGTESRHRIDPQVIKTDVTAAGFVLEAESDLLRNPSDDHKTLVFDPAIRGHTDQVIFRFRNPR